MTFPDNFELLYNKNVWIFDTGASCNSSGCMDGAINIRDDNSEVIPANGVCIKQDMAMKTIHFADKVPAFVKYLRTFGEAGVVIIAGYG
jgi:hypothetical protein